MTIVEAATIYQALAKFSELFDLKFNDALSIIKLKNSLKDYYDLVCSKEKVILLKYAQKDKNGNIQQADNGSIEFKDERSAKLAMDDFKELYNQKANIDINKIKVAMPDKKGDMTLSEIEALMEVIEFE